MPNSRKKKSIIWLRAETVDHETRSPLSPEDAATLVEAGLRVVVERSPVRCFKDREYKKAGCELVPTGTWPTAPRDALILGIKNLPEDFFALKHQHMYYGHLFKGQKTAQEILERYVQGGGSLFDYEYLKDKNGKTIVSTSYWAGFVGAALASWAWAEQQLNRPRKSGEGYLPPLKPFATREALAKFVEKRVDAAMAKSGKTPSILVTGGMGICGTGAKDFLSEIGLASTAWGTKETSGNGPFPEILKFNILIHCVSINEPTQPFLHLPLLKAGSRNLTVISDVTCDLDNPCNVLPVYEKLTTFENAVCRLEYASSNPVDLIAIDRLPALLPLECSREFSERLVPLLLDLAAPKSGAWEEAERAFQEASAPLRESRRRKPAHKKVANLR